LKGLKKNFVVLSSKGGVGKSTISTLLAFYAAERNLKVGLIDLDFTNPSTHVILGVNPVEITYTEDKGLFPHKVNSLSYITPIAFTKDLPLPLRGDSVSKALLELLSILRLDGLEYLVIDTPPGLGDEHMDLMYKLGDLVKPLVVSTPSILSLGSVKRMIHLLKEANVGEVFLVENMGDGKLVEFARELDVVYLGYIPYYPGFDRCLGSLEGLRKCPIRGFFENILGKITQDA
jgi:ATP-binding protein involved in chromosome partitioning